MTEDVSSVIPNGYDILSVYPTNSGDNQFAIWGVYFSKNRITVSVSNWSSTVDSGYPVVDILCIKKITRIET